MDFDWKSPFSTDTFTFSSSSSLYGCPRPNLLPFKDCVKKKWFSEQCLHSEVYAHCHNRTSFCSRPQNINLETIGYFIAPILSISSSGWVAPVLPSNESLAVLIFAVVLFPTPQFSRLVHSSTFLMTVPDIPKTLMEGLLKAKLDAMDGNRPVCLNTDPYQSPSKPTLGLGFLSSKRDLQVRGTAVCLLLTFS